MRGRGISNQRTSSALMNQIEIVIGIYETQHGTQLRVEAEVADPEQPSQRGSHAAEVAAPVLGECRDCDRCRGKSDENDGDRQQIKRDQQRLGNAARPKRAGGHEHQREHADADRRRNQDSGNGERWRAAVHERGQGNRDDQQNGSLRGVAAVNAPRATNALHITRPNHEALSIHTALIASNTKTTATLLSRRKYLRSCSREISVV
jgi:hypothetical protein